MVEALINGLMEDYTTEVIPMIRSTAKESTYGQMAELTLVTGLMANKLMKEFTFYQMEQSERVCGKMVSKKDGLTLQKKTKLDIRAT
jgi:hypothetical protein